MTSFVFFGTPEPAVEILDALKRAGLVPSLIVTNPDRPQGRKMVLTPPPVKVWAVKNNIPVLQPENPSDPDFLYKLKAKSYQLFIVVAYGSILPKAVLDFPTHGALNLHYSLLPKYRGASPIESQILADDNETGVSILLLDEEMDHGPIVARSALQFTNHNDQIPNNTQIQNSNIKTPAIQWPPKARELRGAMNAVAGELLVKTIPLWVEGKIGAKPQDHSLATYTKKFTKADGELHLDDDPYKNFLKIQAFEGSIGTFFYTEATRNEANTKQIRKIRVVIKEAKFRDGKLTITRVVPEGKKEMTYEEFLRGSEKI